MTLNSYLLSRELLSVYLYFNLTTEVGDKLKFNSKGQYALTWSLSGLPWLERLNDVGDFTIVKIINPHGIGTSIVTNSTTHLPKGVYQTSITFTSSNKMTINSTVPDLGDKTVNGLTEFYNRSYKDITNISVHNCQAIDQINSSKLYNCLVSLSTANQSIPIYAQLLYGVRVLQFQLHYDLFGTLCLSHGPWIFDPARIPFKKLCEIIDQFIDVYPDTLLTLIINNATGKDDVKVLTDIESGLNAYNLTTKCYKYADKSWPTCGDLVYNRLKNLILISNIYTERSWMNNDNYVVSSRYDYKTVDEFIHEDLSIYDKNNPNYYWKGHEDAVKNKTRTLWMMSNSITPPLYAGGCVTKAKELNLKTNIWYRYDQFSTMISQRVNMIGCDFIQVSFLDLLEFYYEVNGIKVQV